MSLLSCGLGLRGTGRGTGLRRVQGVKRIAILNGGTIPDRGTYGVFLAGERSKPVRVGELDEEMVFESRAGETFILGASTWRIDEITHDRVLVTPAPGEAGQDAVLAWRPGGTAAGVWAEDRRAGAGAARCAA